MVETLWFIVLLGIVAVIAVKAFQLRRVTVYEYQRGLKYRKGRFVETLGAGRYWTFPSTTITIVDVRPTLVSIPGQEVFSADGVTVKISLAAEFEVADPAVAINKNANYQQATYLVLQMAVRQLVSGQKIDNIIENRVSLSDQITQVTREKVAAIGIRLLSAEVKDVMLPGELRRTFAQIVKAQKEGQAALERARGETAALRSLANAAKMTEENPNLLQLRALQMMADSTGNTIMLGVSGVVVPTQNRKNGAKDGRNEEESK